MDDTKADTTTNYEFTPNTLKELNLEINDIENKIKEIESLPLDPIVKESPKDRLQSTLVYYYGQKYKHEISVLNKASQIPINDEDMDTVNKDLFSLKLKIDDLVNNIRKYRELNNNDDNFNN